MNSEFSRKKALVLGALILVFLAIPVTVYTALQVQETRSRAAETDISPTPIPTLTPTPTPIPAESKCYECTTYPDVTTNTTWIYNGDNTVTIRATISKNFTDNSYGTNSIGWPSKVRGHRFSDLVGSDNLNIALYDNAGTIVMDFQVDYITASSNVTSGYETLCVTEGDGQMNVGNASDVVGCKTALSENFNDFGYVLTTDSPATDENYSQNSTYPNWIYDVWYEITVKTAPFEAGGGVKEPIISEIHSSPSKKPDATCPLQEITCTFTPTPSTIPSLSPTPTPTLPPNVSPTPPYCPLPTQVSNVKISCPNCSN